MTSHAKCVPKYPGYATAAQVRVHWCSVYKTATLQPQMVRIISAVGAVISGQLALSTASLAASVQYAKFSRALRVAGCSGPETRSRTGSRAAYWSRAPTASPPPRYRRRGRRVRSACLGARGRSSRLLRRRRRSAGTGPGRPGSCRRGRGPGRCSRCRCWSGQGRPGKAGALMYEAGVRKSVTIAAAPEQVGQARAFGRIAWRVSSADWDGAFFLRWLRSYGGRPVGARHPVSGTVARPGARPCCRTVTACRSRTRPSPARNQMMRIASGHSV
jgi:hypothetical protein